MGDVENLLAPRATRAQRLQVILQTGHGVGQGVELPATGHAALLDQFSGNVATHALQVIGRSRELQHAQGAGNLDEQARHFDQAVVVPIGFDECDDMLAGVGEIGHRLLRQRFQRAPRLCRAGIVLNVDAGTQVGHLIVERGVHVQQRAGDIQ